MGHIFCVWSYRFAVLGREKPCSMRSMRSMRSPCSTRFRRFRCSSVPGWNMEHPQGTAAESFRLRRRRCRDRRVYGLGRAVAIVVRVCDWRTAADGCRPGRLNRRARDLVISDLVNINVSRMSAGRATGRYNLDKDRIERIDRMPRRGFEIDQRPVEILPCRCAILPVFARLANV